LEFKKGYEEDFKLIKWLEPKVDQVFVDIGYNRGERITYVLIMNDLGTKVIGFESNSATYEKLKGYISNREEVTTKVLS
jgi:hypothetical protein